MKRLLLPILTFFFGATSLCAQDFETAQEAVGKMGPGWNLGNTLDAHNGKRMTDIVASETTWGQPVTRPELMKMMKDAGFGAIRVPVTWYPHMNDAGVVDAAWMKRVHEVVDYVINEGMYCVLNVHHDTGADNDSHKSWLKADASVYTNVKTRYENLWRQIANEFKDYGEQLLFEAYNEMLDSHNSWCYASFAASSYSSTSAAASYKAINDYAQSFVNVVRATGGNNAKRNLVVNTYAAACGYGTWSQYLQDPLKKMQLPDDPAGKGHILFQVHSYPNLDNLTSAKKEIDGTITNLKTHLVSKGAPVIIGEWGWTASDGQDYYKDDREKVLDFASYMVKKAKAAGMVPFFWMGLSDGTSRTLPAFTQPDLAETIVKTWRGDDFEGTYPVIDDYELTYKVKYTGDWQELNLVSSSFSLSNYKGIRVLLKKGTNTNAVQIKCYGGNGKEQYGQVTRIPEFTLNFNASTLGTSVSRVTLQTCKGAQEVTVEGAYLIKKDNTEEKLSAFSPFWGCTVELISVPLGIESPAMGNIASDERIFNLQGQQVDVPTTPGIYIKGGKKYYYHPKNSNSWMK